MITVKIQGGLGNQLFQYAYARALLEIGKEIELDISFFENDNKYTKRKYLLDKFFVNEKFKITKEDKKQKFITRVINKIDIDRRVRYVKVNPKDDNFIADGYYCTEKYFSSIRDILIQEVNLKEKSDHCKIFENKILSSNKSLMIHARRGDFLKSTGFVILNESYYERALKEFDEGCEIFLFSDDIDWLKNIIKRPAIAISGNGLTDYEELSLMSLGQNFIIANSTFSWWGAWLSNSENKKVIAPKKWFSSIFWFRANRDVVPESWIRI